MHFFFLLALLPIYTLVSDYFAEEWKKLKTKVKKEDIDEDEDEDEDED